MKPIRVYEHREYKVGKRFGDITFTSDHLKKLQNFHSRNSSFYSLINNGVKFCEYVGVLKVGNLVIEVLPKTDGINDEEALWQQFLIDMLRVSGLKEIEQTGFTSLRLRSNSILDLYMELFLKEVQYLLHTGLVKKYRKVEGNSFAMKGTLLFNKNIQQNLTHAERFYVRYNVYDKDNVFNSLLLKTVYLISRIGNQAASASAKGILIDFPDCKDINASEQIFNKLVYDRKTEGYRKAINMAKLLLLNYHPDIQDGKNDVLALMFNMNELWEKYVFNLLRKRLHKDCVGKYEVKEQIINHFWKPEGGYMRLVRPDIVVYDTNKPQKVIAVLDTKWKNPANKRPDDADLKQMLVYNLYNTTKNSALIYPSNIVMDAVKGVFQKYNGNCSLIFLPLKATNNKMELQLEGMVTFIENCYKQTAQS